MLDKEIAELIERVSLVCINERCYVEFIDNPLSHEEKVRLDQAGFWSIGSMVTIGEGKIKGKPFSLGSTPTEMAMLYPGKQPPTSVEVALLTKAGQELISSLGKRVDWDSFSRKLLVDDDSCFVVLKINEDGTEYGPEVTYAKAKRPTA